MGIIRGDLLEWEGSASRGELAIRSTDDRVSRCAYDGKTYFERDRQRVSMLNLKPGEKVEMVADYRQNSLRCYALMVHVLDGPAPTPYRRLTIPSRAPTESIFPRGNLTFAGVVLRMTAQHLLLRTNAGKEQRFSLRQDTRFVQEGAIVQASMLRVNTRVFIRAGKNYEDEVEAYQVMWGEIVPAR